MRKRTRTATAAATSLRDYATLGAAMQIDRMFATLPVLYRAVVATRPGQSVAATVQQAIAEYVPDPDHAEHGQDDADEQPGAEHPEPPHGEQAPRRKPAKPPRGQQRQRQQRQQRNHRTTHRTPKGRAKRHLSRAARQAIGARMRDYWAKRRAYVQGGV